MEEELIIAAVLLVLASGAVACVLAGLLWIKLRQLERRVAGLEAGRQASPAAPSTAGAASVWSPVVAPPLAADVALPVAVAGNLATPAATAASRPPLAPRPSSRTPTSAADWEARIAGRWLNRVGLAAVAVGVAYFLKYAIDNDWIGPTGQVVIGLLLGSSLVVAGSWLVRRGYAYFADGLAGLGAVVLYLSVWAAGSYYHLVSPTVAFVMMVGVTAGILAIALGRSSQRVAMVALLGGLLTPVLMDSGQNRPVELFAYLALLNAAVLPLATTRGWRQLEWVAFLFTQFYYLIWLDQNRVPEMFWIGLAAGTVFFVEFFALPALGRVASSAFSAVHAVVSVANPAMYLLALHGLLWPDHRWALTFAALALAALHLLVARTAPVAEDGRPAIARVLPASLALAFLTIAVPIRLSGVWIPCAWAAEGAAIIWTGFRVNLWPLRALGLVLFVIVGLQLPGWDRSQMQFLWNPRLLAAAVTAASFLAAIIAARRHRALLGPNEQPWFVLLGIVTNVVVIWALTREVQTFFRSGQDAESFYQPRLAEGLVISLLWIAGATALLSAGVRTAAAALRWQGLALFGIAALKVFFYDLAALSGFYRIGSSIALGLLLLGVSFVYQRHVVAERADESAP